MDDKKEFEKYKKENYKQLMIDFVDAYEDMFNDFVEGQMNK